MLRCRNKREKVENVVEYLSFRNLRYATSAESS